MSYNMWSQTIVSYFTGQMKQFVTPDGIPFESLDHYREVVDLLRRLGNDIWSECTGRIDYRSGHRVLISQHRRSIPLTGIARLVLYFSDSFVFYGAHLRVAKVGHGYKVVYHLPGSFEVFDGEADIKSDVREDQGSLFPPSKFPARPLPF